MREADTRAYQGKARKKKGSAMKLVSLPDQTECPTSEQLISLIVDELGTATADALRLSGSERYGLELAAQTARALARSLHGCLKLLEGSGPTTR